MRPWIHLWKGEIGSKITGLARAQCRRVYAPAIHRSEEEGTYTLYPSESAYVLLVLHTQSCCLYGTQGAFEVCLLTAVHWAVIPYVSALSTSSIKKRLIGVRSMSIAGYPGEPKNRTNREPH